MKDKNVAAILALFLGGIGVHKFYLGRTGAGLMYLLFSLTMIPALLAVIDFFVLALMDTDEFNRRFNGANMLPQVVVNMLPPAGYMPGYPPVPYGAPGYPPQPNMHGGYPPPPHGAPGYPQQPGLPPAAPVGGGLSPEDLAKKLEKLNELRIAGLLSEEEFNQQKSRVLGQT
ncbi:MAG: NINE protein [Nannocystaceae bacterium]|nr:NINE protein [Nannocystaceae bacterium]